MGRRKHSRLQKVTSLSIPQTENKMQTSRSAFEIFPEELWEMILDQFDHSKDIQSVWAAFPELDFVFQTRKARWLIDQAFPFIYARVHESLDEGKLILSCRAVSRRWCKVVEFFLTDHPSRRPYKINGLSRRTLGYQDFVYQDEVPQLPSLQMQTTEEIRAVITKLEQEHPLNPFLLRVVKLKQLYVDRSTDNLSVQEQLDQEEMDGRRSGDFLDSCILFVQSFGHLIWDLSLRIGPFNLNPEDILFERIIFQKIIQLLSHVQNVRSLEVLIEFLDPEYKNKWSKELQLPALPHLETLKIETSPNESNECCSSLIHAMFETYAQRGQIKSLKCPLKFWKPKYKKYCPDFLQLSICASTSRSSDQLPCSILKNVGFSSLQKLQIYPPVDVVALNLFDLFQTISCLSIEELEFCDPSRRNKISWCPPNPNEGTRMPNLRSVKWLRLSDTTSLDFGFLKTMPRLEHLNLTANREIGERFINGGNGDIEKKPPKGRKRKLAIQFNDDTIKCQIRSYLYLGTIPKSVSIWKILPSLKILTVNEHLVFGKGQFFREHGNKAFQNLPVGQLHQDKE